MKTKKQLEKEIQQLEWKHNVMIDLLDQQGICYEKGVMEKTGKHTGLASFWKAPKEYHKRIEEYLEVKFELIGLKKTLTQTNEIIKLIEEEVMFKNPNENLSMSTLVFNQLVRDLLLKKIKGDGK
ncbi:hypothetical protein LCGC14_0545970 [marine sediment metagenome]|uniref:Uncharacterized protein n=1 Tax=marine sediment metagenome TaxID=412755 RepID=A0A0F9S9T0_9ZZZZ